MNISKNKIKSFFLMSQGSLDPENMIQWFLAQKLWSVARVHTGRHAQKCSASFVYPVNLVNCHGNTSVHTLFSCEYALIGVYSHGRLATSQASLVACQLRTKLVRNDIKRQTHQLKLPDDTSHKLRTEMPNVVRIQSKTGPKFPMTLEVTYALLNNISKEYSELPIIW